MELNSKSNRNNILVSSGPFLISSSSSTRISETQTQSIRVSSSTAFSQQGFFQPFTMNSSNSGNNESNILFNRPSSNLQQQLARRFKDMSINLDGFSMMNNMNDNSPTTTTSVIRTNGSPFENARVGNMSVATTSFQAMQTQQQQFTSSSNSWTSDANESGNEDHRQGMTRTMRSMLSAGGSISSHGISTSAGFPAFPTSFSNDHMSSLFNNDNMSQPMFISNGNNSDSLLQHSPTMMSPGRAPFTFRNFAPPMMSNNSLHNQMSRDGNTTVFSSGKAQVTVSQAFMQSHNGKIEIAEGRQFVLRQSYGASESESDEDDEFYELKPKRLGFKKPSALGWRNKLAILDKPKDVAPSEDDSSTVASEVESASTITDEPKGIPEVEPSDPTTPEHKKCHKVAQELLTTERTYVRILHLIDQEFHFRVDTENRNKTMFPNDIVTQMFCNIKSLYQLHQVHLLPRLEDRLERWEDDPRIGDIMKEFAPFLKMYSEYVQNFDNSINLINYYRDKNPRFANIINEVQKLEACANLPIQHHLIGPIQRIPRYRLLLEAYLKRLPENSNDRKDSESALSIVSKAAEHANEAMRRIAGFKKLLEVQEQIKGAIDLVSPTRTLIKEGKVSKISARNDYHQERYLFLFSDMVLLCSVRAMANKLISGAAYQLRAKLDVAEITISEGDDLEVANSFYISDDNKKIELYTSNADEKRAWMEAMYQARTNLMARKSSLRPGSSRLSVEDLGVVEPAKIKSDSVTNCMECDVTFSITRRRHHCHACGSVVCDKCSHARVKMEYGDGKLKRVCESCKIVLQGKEAARRSGADPSTPDELIEKVQGVLDVPGSIPAVFSGYLDLRLREKKEWTTRWFALRSDFVLYCYNKEADERATTATPIPGMEVAMADELPKNEVSSLPVAERDRTFRITHVRGRKHFFFLAPSRAAALNWLDKLKQAAKADLNVNNINGSNN